MLLNLHQVLQFSINSLRTNEILLVAGKGHEKIQDIGKKKIYFSDRKIILDSIKIKNSNLSNSFKLNIIKEISASKKLPSNLYIKQAKINSKDVKKNDIFLQ